MDDLELILAGLQVFILFFDFRYERRLNKKRGKRRKVPFEEMTVQEVKDVYTDSLRTLIVFFILSVINFFLDTNLSGSSLIIFLFYMTLRTPVVCFSFLVFMERRQFKIKKDSDAQEPK